MRNCCVSLVVVPVCDNGFLLWGTAVCLWSWFQYVIMAFSCEELLCVFCCGSSLWECLSVVNRCCVFFVVVLVCENGFLLSRGAGCVCLSFSVQMMLERAVYAYRFQVRYCWNWPCVPKVCPWFQPVYWGNPFLLSQWGVASFSVEVLFGTGCYAVVPKMCPWFQPVYWGNHFFFFLRGTASFFVFVF